jgi:hypothetical protein
MGILPVSVGLIVMTQLGIDLNQTLKPSCPMLLRLCYARVVHHRQRPAPESARNRRTAITDLHEMSPVRTFPNYRASSPDLSCLREIDLARNSVLPKKHRLNCVCARMS